MLLLRCSSAKPLGAIVSAAEALGAPILFLSPHAIEGKSEMEMAFAFYLARRAFGSRNGISGKLENEALLFLARETNFSSALRKTGAGDARDFVLVCEKNLPPARVKKALALTKAGRVRLARMGKKKGRYFEGELAAEQMALARVRN